MRHKKRRVKRLLLVTSIILLMSAGVFCAFSFSRFHFSNQSFPLLAQLRGNPSPTLDLSMFRPTIVGHRGAVMPSSIPGLKIGNTSAAIQQAIDGGVDWIEIDIRCTSDGHLVVFHDETIDLKTTGTGAVSELSLDQLKSIDVLVDPTEKILTLEEVLTKFQAPQRKWILDIKAKGISDQLLGFLNERVTSDQVILFGSYDVLMEYATCGYPLGYTVVWKQFGNQLRVLFAPFTIVRRCEQLGCDYLVLPVIFASPSLIDAAKVRGFEVWVYGTEDELDLRFFARCDIDGLIIDNPRRTMRLFSNGEMTLP